LQRQREEIIKQKDDDDKQYSFRPELIAKQFQKDPLLYGTKNNDSAKKDVFQALYETKDAYRQRLEKKRQEISSERDQAFTGIPKIAPKSPKLAEKRRQRRDDIAASVGYDSDSTIGYSSAGGGYYNRGAFSTDVSELDSHFGVSLKFRNLPYVTPTMENTDNKSVDLSSPYMMEAEIATPEVAFYGVSSPLLHVQQPQLHSPIQSPDHSPYTGIEAPIVRRSVNGSEERSTMSYSMSQRGRPTSASDPSRRRSASAGSVRSVRSTSSVGSTGMSSASSRLELFDSLYQVLFMAAGTAFSDVLCAGAA
jgi:hypothetical protein